MGRLQGLGMGGGCLSGRRVLCTRAASGVHTVSLLCVCMVAGVGNDTYGYRTTKIRDYF